MAVEEHGVWPWGPAAAAGLESALAYELVKSMGCKQDGKFLVFCSLSLHHAIEFNIAHTV